jgi:hypothetical protein
MQQQETELLELAHRFGALKKLPIKSPESLKPQATQVSLNDIIRERSRFENGKLSVGQSNTVRTTSIPINLDSVVVQDRNINRKLKIAGA